MKTYLKYLACFMAVVLVTATIAYSLVALKFSPIEDLAVISHTKNSATLYWKKQTSVTGYKVYMKTTDDSDFKEVKNIRSNEKNKVVIDNLKQDEKIAFKVAPYKTFIATTKVGTSSDVVWVYTWPKAQKIESLTESKIGFVTVSWSASKIASGYELEYSPFADFSYSKKIDVKGKDSTAFKIRDVLSGRKYHFRVRAYANFNGEVVRSAYSKTKKLFTQKEFLDIEIDPTKPVIALTFDDGPSNSKSTKRILNVIEKYGITATFFCVGENVKNHPDTVKRMSALGCEIGNHTYTHENYGSSVTKGEIASCSNIIKSVVGYRPQSMRSTGGITNNKIKKWAKAQGMTLYYWTVDTHDWRSRNTKKILKKIMTAKDGDIVLMHDIYGETAAAVEKAIPKLIKKGYQFVTVSQLVKIKQNKAPTIGVEYITGSKLKGD